MVLELDPNGTVTLLMHPGPPWRQIDHHRTEKIRQEAMAAAQMERVLGQREARFDEPLVLSSKAPPRSREA